jgi:hypothetical protein
VTNSSKSAFCLFKLQPRFFSRYKALGTPSEQRKGVKCKLLVKVGPHFSYLVISLVEGKGKDEGGGSEEGSDGVWLSTCEGAGSGRRDGLRRRAVSDRDSGSLDTRLSSLARYPIGTTQFCVPF